MQENMTKTKLLHLIQTERQMLEEALSDIEQEDMVAPALQGGWSIKDLLAHITTWEQNMISWLGVARKGNEPQLVPPGFSSWDEIDAINQSYYLQNSKKELFEVLNAFNKVYIKALKIVQETSEDDLIDPNRFPWRKGEPIWHMVAANTFWHYEEHRVDIEVWKELK